MSEGQFLKFLHKGHLVPPVMHYTQTKKKRVLFLGNKNKQGNNILCAWNDKTLKVCRQNKRRHMINLPVCMCRSAMGIAENEWIWCAVRYDGRDSDCGCRNFKNLYIRESTLNKHSWRFKRMNDFEIFLNGLSEHISNLHGMKGI